MIELLAPPVATAAPAGRGRLLVERSGSRSVVSQAYAASPLRWLTPRNHGPAAWIYSSTYGGGLVDGDQIVLDVGVAAGASAYLATQASTKVYKSARGTLSQMDARVDAGGLLIVAPDPVVCFARSRYRQVQRVDLAGDGGLVLVDWMTCGRKASGERWAFDEYVAKVSVHVDARLVVHDALALRASDGALDARLGRFDVLATVAVVGLAMAAEIGQVMWAADTPLARRAEQLCVATPIGEIGCVVRIAGRSVEHVGRTIRRLLAFVPDLLGDDPWRRKW